MEIQLPKKPRIFGTSIKTQKGLRKGVSTLVCFLAPGNTSKPFGGMETCAASLVSDCTCRKGCLAEWSGRLRLDCAKRARLWKTVLLRQDPDRFWKLVKKEIRQHEKLCKRKGLIPAVRFNGSSDLPFSCIRSLAVEFPETRFYDYTKSLVSIQLYLEEKVLGDLKNVHLTLSWHNMITPYCMDYLETGGNVVVVFSGPLPTTLFSFPVLDGDEHDARFLDPPGFVVGLKWKGPRSQLREVLHSDGSSFVWRSTESESV